MKTKQLLKWVIAFIVLAGVVITAGMLRVRRPSEKSLRFFPAFSVEKCSMVLIAVRSDTVRIKRSGDVWLLEGTAKAAVPAGIVPEGEITSEDSQGFIDKDFPVDSASLASMLEKLAEMKKDELVSQNIAKQALFEVDSANATFVQVFDEKGKSWGAIRIGKNSPAGWSSHYARMDGSNDVFIVHGGVKHSFFAERNRWKDKTVVKFPKSNAKRLVLTRKAQPPVIIDKSTDSLGAAVWDITAPVQSRAATDKVDDLLEAMARFTCLDWESENRSDADMGFVSPQLLVTAVLEGGIEKKLLIGSKMADQTKYWVRTPDSPEQTFQCSSHLVERLDKSLDVLKEPAK